MSKRRQDGWANGKFYAWARTIPLRGARKAVLKELASRADRSGEAFPSIPRLARETGFAPSTVREALKALEEAGYVTKIARKREDGGDTSNLYVLHDLGTAKEANAGPPEAGGGEHSDRRPPLRPVQSAPTATGPKEEGGKDKEKEEEAAADSPARAASSAPPTGKTGAGQKEAPEILGVLRDTFGEDLFGRLLAEVPARRAAWARLRPEDLRAAEEDVAVAMRKGVNKKRLTLLKEHLDRYTQAKHGLVVLDPPAADHRRRAIDELAEEVFQEAYGDALERGLPEAEADRIASIARLEVLQQKVA